MSPFVPDTAPFTPDQRAWLNGFFAGLYARQPATPTPPDRAPALPVTILYASQTGTCETLAKQAAKTAAAHGFAPTVLDAATIPDVATLAVHPTLLVITSTYGDGEPPDSAKTLHTALLAAEPRSLPATMRFAVCGLGDTNYEKFCQCGKDFDTALARAGATRLAARADCDTDYDVSFATWLDAALAALAGETTPNPVPAPSSPPVTKPAAPTAAVLAVRRLNAPGSAKEVNHIELSLADTGLSYEAGDALAVHPHNCPELVDAIVGALGCDGEEAVPTPAGDLPLRLALTRHYDLGKPKPELCRAALQPASASTPSAPSPADVLDALQLLPEQPTPAAFVAALRPLKPRLYSISSSPKAHPGEVHLTVGAVRYELAGRTRKGACSTFLAERALALGRLQISVHRNTAFRPPADPAAPMIMIGPGTGIAPFRAFLEERAATAASGRNWLFFGDQHAATDFLYREELEAWLASGLLTRLDTAFSRDQAEKLYVQHRLLAHADEVFAWLEAGAHLYVCGDAARMAKDVDAALHRVIETAGPRSAADAAAYVQALKAAKRYARDVY